jgi:hypothetical protein
VPLTNGSRIGPFEILAPLGAGGMGEVYRARDTRLNRDVAVKVLPQAFATDPDRLARFEREAQAIAALSHPNILAIHDFGTSDGVAYAVMELLDGATLRERLESGPFRCGAPSTTPCNSRVAWRRRTIAGSFTATSNRKTCSSPRTNGARFWTLASRAARSRRSPATKPTPRRARRIPEP